MVRVKKVVTAEVKQRRNGEDRCVWRAGHSVGFMCSTKPCEYGSTATLTKFCAVRRLSGDCPLFAYIYPASHKKLIGCGRCVRRSSLGNNILCCVSEGKRLM